MIVTYTQLSLTCILILTSACSGLPGVQSPTSASLLANNDTVNCNGTVAIPNSFVLFEQELIGRIKKLREAEGHRINDLTHTLVQSAEFIHNNVRDLFQRIHEINGIISRSKYDGQLNSMLTESSNIRERT